jgi:hypothetical protein
MSTNGRKDLATKVLLPLPYPALLMIGHIEIALPPHRDKADLFEVRFSASHYSLRVASQIPAEENLKCGPRARPLFGFLQLGGNVSAVVT